jgi:hypothetical protein
MLVTLRTAGRLGIANYNQSVPIEFDCAICGEELEADDDGVIEHPTEVDDGIIRTKIRKLDCKQAGMKARAVIEIPNVYDKAHRPPTTGI